MSKKQDTVIIIEGGAMLGVFGAGVVTAFHGANLYPRIHSIYAWSAGAHDAAYFLAAQADPRQIPAGASIYWEHCSGDQFVRPRRFFSYLWDMLCRRCGSKRPIRHVVDLDHLEQVERGVKVLDVGAIRSQPIPWYVGVYDIDRYRMEWRDGNIETVSLLKATATAPPYYAAAVTVASHRYIDGGYLRDNGILDIIRQHSDKRIVYVVNRRKTVRNSLLGLPEEIFESALLWLMFDWKVAWRHLVNAWCIVDTDRLRRFPNVTIVCNELGYRSSETNPDNLKKLYQHGVEEGKKALSEIRS